MKPLLLLGFVLALFSGQYNAQIDQIDSCIDGRGIPKGGPRKIYENPGGIREHQEN